MAIVANHTFAIRRDEALPGPEPSGGWSTCRQPRRVGRADDRAGRRGGARRAGDVQHDDVLGPAAVGQHAVGGVVEERAARRPSARRAAIRSRYSARTESGSRAWAATAPPADLDRRQPRLAVAEAAVARVVVPAHRVAMAVAAGAVVGRLAARAVGHADLVALVDEHRSGQRQREQRRGARVAGADAIGQAREVVVGEHPGDAAARRRRRPARRRSRARSAPASQGACSSSKANATSSCCEVRRELRPTAGRPRRRAARPPPRPRAAAPARRSIPGALRLWRCSTSPALAELGQQRRRARRRVVAQLGILQEAVDRVEAEAVDAAAAPEGAAPPPTPARTSARRQSRSGCSG